MGRHLRTASGRTEAIRWHIDYLLSAPGVDVETVYVKESKDREECASAELVAGHGYPVREFGCSDCDCVSHLSWVEEYSFLQKLGLRKKALSEFTS